MSIRKLREERGLTQEEAAERASYSVQQLRRAEGATISVTLGIMVKLATAYKVELTELFASTALWETPRTGRPRATAVPQDSPPRRARAR